MFLNIRLHSMAFVCLFQVFFKPWTVLQNWVSMLAVTICVFPVSHYGLPVKLASYCSDHLHMQGKCIHRFWSHWEMDKSMQWCYFCNWLDLGKQARSSCGCRNWSLIKSVFHQGLTWERGVKLAIFDLSRPIARGIWARNKTNAYNTSSGCVPSIETLAVCLTQIWVPKKSSRLKVV